MRKYNLIRAHKMYMDWLDGNTLQVIADKYRITRQRVSQLFQGCGFEIDDRNITKSKIEVVIQLHHNGCLPGAIAEESQLSEARVYDILRMNNLIPNKKHSIEIVREMYALYENGFNQKQIAQRYGVTQTTIGRLFRIHNLLTRPRFGRRYDES